jgi:hypothetical protein
MRDPSGGSGGRHTATADHLDLPSPIDGRGGEWSTTGADLRAPAEECASTRRDAEGLWLRGSERLDRALDAGPGMPGRGRGTGTGGSTPEGTLPVEEEPGPFHPPPAGGTSQQERTSALIALGLERLEEIALSVLRGDRAQIAAMIESALCGRRSHRQSEVLRQLVVNKLWKVEHRLTDMPAGATCRWAIRHALSVPRRPTAAPQLDLWSVGD